MSGNPFSLRRGALAACSVVMVVAALRIEAQPAAGASDAELARVEASVAAAEAVRTVKHLQRTLAHYLDAGLWTDAADLFTESATAELDGATLSGKRALRTHWLARAGRDADGLAAGQLNAHLLMQPIVTLGADGRTARGTWHEVAMVGQLGASATWRGGVYENEYVDDGGVWKISRLRYIEQYHGSYDEFGHHAPPSWGIPYHFAADDVGISVPEAALAALARARQGASRDDTSARLVNLERRVARLHDETAVRNLHHAYGYYVDRKMWDDVADLFADGGSYELATRGAYIGRARIRAALEALYGAPQLRTGELNDHIQLGTVVTIAPDGATAHSRTAEIAQLGQNGEHARWELATYENQYVKEGGVWKIAALRRFPRLATDYDAGWGKAVLPVAGPSTTLPPDRAPVRGYAPYPSADFVAFHYPHPVTGRAARWPRDVNVVAVPAVAERGRGRSAAAIGDARTALERLARGAHAAIGVDAVENLMSSYGYYIDESAWNEMAATFGSTGSKEITGAGVYVGPERIRTVLNLRGPTGGRTANFFTIHQLTQPVIHIAADGLSANARLRLFQSGGNADGSSGSWISGVYENTAIFENGEWKFGRQDLHHILNASYRNGWARLGGGRAGGAGANAGRGGVAPRAGGPGAPRGPGAARAGGPTAPGGAQPAPQRGTTARDVPGGGITQGLGGAASPSRFATEFPPDRAIRARQYAFPDIDVVAFHYLNPVSGRQPPELLP